jgi:hypothetical protein
MKAATVTERKGFHLNPPLCNQCTYYYYHKKFKILMGIRRPRTIIKGRIKRESHKESSCLHLQIVLSVAALLRKIKNDEARALIVQKMEMKTNSMTNSC